MKSADRILARRYARAFDALSQDGTEAAARFEALQQAAQALHAVRAYMQDPAVSSAEKSARVCQLLQGDKVVSGFVCALVQAKRYYLLDCCVEEAGQLLDARLGRVRARVRTAFALSDEQKRRVEEALGRFSGKQACVQYQTDPALLGGLRAQLGDVLIDGTLKRQFEKLKQELTK